MYIIAVRGVHFEHSSLHTHSAHKLYSPNKNRRKRIEAEREREWDRVRESERE